MRALFLIIVLCAAPLALSGGAAASASQGAAPPAQAAMAVQKRELTDDEIADILIQRSIAAYPGACPCPYIRDRAGRRCGARSAYSRRGGASVLCYRRDVTPDMIARHRRE